MRTQQPLSRIRGLRGGSRLANELTHLADVRNHSMLSRLIRASGILPRRTIPMYWFSRVPNLGDVLSRVVVEHLSHGTPVLVPENFPGKLLACGSILSKATAGDWVWGAGAKWEEPITPPPGVVFYAVRGPLTARLIRGDVPEIYGDPAQLLPRIFNPPVEKRFELGVIAHYIEQDLVTVGDPSIRTIDVLAPWREVVQAILSCRAVLSSSLHGLIVAEAYGIPAVWMTASDRVHGRGFKFRDYYLATGREPRTPIAWDRALDDVERHFVEPPKPNVDALLAAWPKELILPPVGP